MFKPLLGKTMEVYIDDMLVKSKWRPDHVTHLQKAFDLLRAYGMKLNPSKCAFGVSASWFLGFVVTQRGIEANSAQLKAILDSPTPSSRKRGTTANRPVSRSKAVHFLVHRPSKTIICHP